MGQSPRSGSRRWPPAGSPRRGGVLAILTVALSASPLRGQTDGAADSSAASLPFLWETGAGRGATAPPLVAGDRLYVATARSSVKAFDLTGRRELWSRDLARGFQGSPRLAGSLLVVAAPHPKAEAFGLDPRTGETRWQHKVGDIAQTPLVEDGRAYFVSLGGWVTALDAGTGDEAWRTRLDGVFPGGALLAGDDLVVLSAAGRIYRLAAASGTHAGSIELGAPSAPGLVPLPDGRGFLAATFDGRIRSFGFDLRPGSLEVTATPLLHAPAAGPGLLVAAGKDRRIRAFDLPSGRPRWERRLEVAAAAPPSVSPDGARVAVSDLAGTVWVLSTADGGTLSRTEIRGAPATPVWSEAGLAVVTDRGVLALLDVGPSRPVAGAPPEVGAPSAQ